LDNDKRKEKEDLLKHTENVKKIRTYVDFIIE
jgi:hypothetical protein